MDTTLLQEAGQTAESQLKRIRWALGLSGALSVAFGVAIIVWPSISLFALVILFGAFALARGIVGLAGALSSPITTGRGWLVVSSLASIVLGVVVLFWTDMSALALLYVIGAYAIVFGIFEIAGAFSLPLIDNTSRAVLGLTGIVSIVFGIVMFAKPGDGALVLLAMIAAYALIVGATELVFAIGGKKLIESAARRSMTSSPARREPQASH
jgi:uncharacterized membrane protein HdeD (DUF308 family)